MSDPKKVPRDVELRRQIQNLQLNCENAVRGMDEDINKSRRQATINSLIEAGKHETVAKDERQKLRVARAAKGDRDRAFAKADADLQAGYDAIEVETQHKTGPIRVALVAAMKAFDAKREKMHTEMLEHFKRTCDPLIKELREIEAADKAAVAAQAAAREVKKAAEATTAP